MAFACRAARKENTNAPSCPWTSSSEAHQPSSSLGNPSPDPTMMHHIADLGHAFVILRPEVKVRNCRRNLWRGSAHLLKRHHTKVVEAHLWTRRHARAIALRTLRSYRRVRNLLVHTLLPVLMCTSLDICSAKGGTSTHAKL